MSWQFDQHFALESFFVAAQRDSSIMVSDLTSLTDLFYSSSSYAYFVAVLTFWLVAVTRSC